MPCVFQVMSFSSAVADLAGDDQRLLVVFDGFLCLSYLGVAVAFGAIGEWEQEREPESAEDWYEDS